MAAVVCLRQLAALSPNHDLPAYFVISSCIAAPPCLCCLYHSPRSRYTHLSWALFEKKEGKVEEARRLFKAGSELNPRDAAILQVGGKRVDVAGIPRPTGLLAVRSCWGLQHWRAH